MLIIRLEMYLGYFYKKIGCARCASILTRFFFRLIFILLWSECFVKRQAYESKNGT